MQKRARARIQWLSPEAGGRKRPPIGPKGTKYSNVCHFEVDPVDRYENAWSLVVQFEGPSCGELEIMATVWFLFPEAPHEFLQAGNRFELYEGYRLVATGEILG